MTNRPRSKSAPTPPTHELGPMRKREAVTHSSHYELPQQFQSVLREGILPGSRLPGALHSADADPRAQVSVQRMQAQPTPDHLRDAMVNPARGIIPVTAERRGQPLPTEERTSPARHTALTNAGEREASQRVEVSMLVSATPPTPAPAPMGVSEQFVPAVPPASITGVAVSQPLQGPLQDTTARPVVGADSATFPRVRLGGAQATVAIDAPDYRPFMQAQTSNSPRDFHVVRADAVVKTHKRSATR